jgi:tetratricopeptide (TPR) repeat protein
LKYIREALEFSDDHMIKHYFSKANTKFMLARYDEAIKDYTNAIIVYKEQVKNDVEVKDPALAKKSVKAVQKEEADEEYFS